MPHSDPDNIADDESFEQELSSCLIYFGFLHGGFRCSPGMLVYLLASPRTIEHSHSNRGSDEDDFPVSSSPHVLPGRSAENNIVVPMLPKIFIEIVVMMIAKFGIPPRVHSVELFAGCHSVSNGVKEFGFSAVRWDPKLNYVLSVLWAFESSNSVDLTLLADRDVSVCSIGVCVCVCVPGFGFALTCIA
jgi:hypothetical protein